MNTKTLTNVEIKNAARGEVSAVFATFNVVDADGDVTVPGAFAGNGEVPISAYGHASWGSGVPIGKGSIRETDTEAILDGRLFMDTQAGRDTFAAIKELGELGQWSYGYDTLLADPGTMDGREVQFLKQQRVYEVSPVLRGAGVGTRTISAKGHNGTTEPSYKTAIRPHDTPTTSRAWDGPAVVAAIPDGASVSDLRSVFAFVESGGDPDAKSSYRFPHHHGVGGPANVRAALAGIAVLNGARGGSSIPSGDRQGVYNHLAAHLRDADREPPTLRSGDSGSLKNIDRLPGLLDELAEVVDSIRDVGSSRNRRGKSLSALTFDVLGWAEEDLVRVLADVRALKMLPREALAVERSRFLAQQFRGVRQ